MKTFTITTENFLQWYLNSGSDEEIKEAKTNLGERVIKNLLEVGNSLITVNELFNEANFESIPVSYLVEFDNSVDVDKIELGSLFSNYEVKLVK